ncbi:hypothetical protein [Polyangium jinanense]|uniref:Uncharacterized protein n=1 Tax=Polyangium jinanense TaxID=2829994 RepID=A0A9X3X6N7_9BACT|nr:hypothetical protein [Polyangium jinanense]MDC3956300.1 hypothetical protein [Polyangium jinanense]MDC3982436.1 hypothetical protein [Polyangium jinanense]
MSEHTLASLASALGAPDPALLDALLDGTTEAQLVAKGKHIASSRVLTDVRRLYALAYSFWESATVAQKETLRGFSAELLSVAVHQAIALDAMLIEHEERGDSRGASRATRDAALREAFEKALTLRDQAHSILLKVAGNAAAAEEEVNQAVGTAEDPAALARGLGALIALAKKYVDEPAGPVKIRAEILRLDHDYIAKIEAAADTLATTARAASARPAGEKVTQGSLDRADGVNLMLLTHIISAFENAHEQDPTIPRLVPISTRRMFERKVKKKSSDEGSAGAIS